MRTEDKIKMLLEKLNASKEVVEAAQKYIYDLVNTAYSKGYDDCKCGLDKHP